MIAGLGGMPFRTIRSLCSIRARLLLLLLQPQLLLLGGSEDKEPARSLLALDKIVTTDVHFNLFNGRLRRPEGKSGQEKAPLPCSWSVWNF